MPAIEISEDQYEFLDGLRGELADEHVGEYGHVRPRDALQFLIDQYESGGADAGGSTAGSGEAPADDDESGADRLAAMMNLLDEHDDKWEEEDDAEEGKYVVTLPDGGTERVRTRDDVRALLFQHYR